MKKTLFSVIFALALSVMFFVTASAAETTKAEEWFNEAHAVSGMITEVTVETGDAAVTQILYTKGDNAASEVTVNGSTIRIIANSKDMIIFSPDMPFIHIKYRGMMEDIIASTPITDTSEFDLTFVKEYQETEGETVYDVEEFTDSEGGICKYYFIGEELDKVETIVEDETASGKLIMDIISYEVDDSIFKVPWYSINIAFLVRIFGLFIF